MATSFSEICTVTLGFKSFLNDFFYVDRDRIHRFGIEKEFLVPIFRLADLDPDSYVQKPVAKRWLFFCEEKPADIRGTGAAAYVKWASKQETVLRKQTKHSVKWPDSPALQNQKYWYSPAAPLHQTDLAIRKGIGARYAPFLFEAPVILDQRLYLLGPKEGVSAGILRAYLASSLFALTIETDATWVLVPGF